jgi:hypothetical protein
MPNGTDNSAVTPPVDIAAIQRRHRDYEQSWTTEPRPSTTKMAIAACSSANDVPVLLAALNRDGICGDEAADLFVNCARTMPSICELRHGHASEWHEDGMGKRWRHARGSAEATAAVIRAARIIRALRRGAAGINPDEAYRALDAAVDALDGVTE